MALTAAERLWGGRALIAMNPGTGGPTPEQIAEEVSMLRALISGPAHELALAPLWRLICAFELTETEVERVQRGSERLRDLGLANVAVAGPSGQVGGEAPEILGHAAPPDLVKVKDARIMAERPPIPSWIGPPTQSGDVLAALRPCISGEGAAKPGFSHALASRGGAAYWRPPLTLSKRLHAARVS